MNQEFDADGNCLHRYISPAYLSAGKVPAICDHCGETIEDMYFMIQPGVLRLASEASDNAKTIREFLNGEETNTLEKSSQIGAAEAAVRGHIERLHKIITEICYLEGRNRPHIGIRVDEEVSELFGATNDEIDETISLIWNQDLTP